MGLNADEGGSPPTWLIEALSPPKCPKCKELGRFVAMEDKDAGNPVTRIIPRDFILYQCPECKNVEIV